MSSVMEIAMREMGTLIETAKANMKILPGPIVNVSGYGAVGDGVTDDTNSVQTAINFAIENGMRTVFFPHGETGQYYVTSLANVDQVDLVGDNASFIGGYSGTITGYGAVAALQAENVTYLTLFNGTRSTGGAQNYQLGLASSNYEREFWTVKRDPILAGTSGTFDSNTIKDPCPVLVGDEIYVYYSGYNGSQERIGLAIKDLKRGGGWYKHPAAPFTLNSDTLTNNNFPFVLYEAGDTGKQFKIWWVAGNEIYYAYGTDGITWTIYGKVLAVGSSGAWDDAFLSQPVVYKQGSTYYMAYAGYDGTGRQQSGLATFTNPESTYTKSSSNPIIPRQITKNKNLSADVASGTRVVTVSDTSVFTAGEPVFIGDSQNSVNFEINRILSIDSSTQLTLVEPTLHGYLSASSGQISGLMFAANNITVIDFEGGVWKVWGTAFQQLYLVGGKLTETTFYAEGSSLESLTVQYDKSPAIGFSRDDTSWDYGSRENMKMIKLSGSEVSAQDIVMDGTNSDSFQGTWTPVLAGGTTPGSNTYSSQVGRYYKVGKMVVVQFSITLSAKDSGMAGVMKIDGLPFAPSASGFAPVFSQIENMALSSSYTQYTGFCSGTSLMLAQLNPTAGTWNNISASAINSNTKIVGSLTYFVA